jgi:hypothetical protein
MCKALLGRNLRQPSDPAFVASPACTYVECHRTTLTTLHINSSHHDSDAGGRYDGPQGGRQHARVVDQHVAACTPVKKMKSILLVVGSAAAKFPPKGAFASCRAEEVRWPRSLTSGNRRALPHMIEPPPQLPDDMSYPFTFPPSWRAQQELPPICCAGRSRSNDTQLQPVDDHYHDVEGGRSRRPEPGLQPLPPGPYHL